jgi:hypothetical protein
MIQNQSLDLDAVLSAFHSHFIVDIYPEFHSQEPTHYHLEKTNKDEGQHA